MTSKTSNHNKYSNEQNDGQQQLSQYIITMMKVMTMMMIITSGQTILTKGHTAGGGFFTDDNVMFNC